MNKKKVIALAVTVGLLTGGVIALTAVGASKKVTELTVWGSQTTTAAVKYELAAYTKKTGIKINFVTVPDSFEVNVLTKWTTGQRPDILMGQPSPTFLGQLNAKKNLQNLSKMSFVSKTKYGLAKNSGVLHGVVYTATVGFPAVFGVFYNKSVFVKSGVSIPKTPAEFATLLKTLKTKGVTPTELAGGDAWTLQLPYIVEITDAVVNGFEQKVATKKTTYTSDPEVTRAINAIKSLVDDGYVNADWKTATFTDQASTLQNGSVAMVIQGSWMLPSFVGSTSNIGFFPYPTKSGKVQWQTSNLGSLQAPITKKPAQEKAARDFIDWATTGAGYKLYLAKAKEPSVISSTATPAGVSKLQNEIADSFLTSGIPSDGVQALASPSDLQGLIFQLLIGTSTTKQVTEQMQSTFEENAKTAGIPGF
jgi:raffinose/stachyose/melibiose transport system substrate-binding protein